MWGIISTVFIVVYLLATYYIGRRGWLAFGKIISPERQKFYWAFFTLIVFLFPVAEMGEDFLPSKAGVLLTTWGGYSMVAMLYIFLLLLIIDLFRLIDKGLGFVPTGIKDNKKTPSILGASVLVLVSSTILYGGWNAQNPVVTKYELAVNKNAGSLEKLRIAMVSDIHYGPIIDDQRLERMVKIMEELKPDVILYAGDITDGNLMPEDAYKLADILSKVQGQYGNYAVPGNHDRELRGDSELASAFKEAGVNILKDNYIKLQDSFYIVGRDNAGHGREQGRKELADVMEGLDSSLPIVLMDHQPIGLKEAEENGVDLQVSGHTHVGQVFPNHLITGKIYELDWGLLQKDKYNLVVSSGYGTWGPPLRIGNHPEVVCVTLNFTGK